MQALAALAAALVVAGALLLFAVSDTTPTDALWESLAGVGIAWDWASAAGRLDPGSARGVLTRVVAVAVSLGGMFVTALLLGIVSEQITEKVSHRAGKESEIPNFKGSYLGRADQADARSLRVALSFVSEARHCAPASDRCIVMEMQDVDNEPLVQLVGGDHVETIVTHDLIGRLMIQSARHPGLAQVWSMLLGFDGCEFYIKHHAELDGVSFGDAFLRFDDAVPIGVIQGSGKDATIWVNPRTTSSYDRATSSSSSPRTTTRTPRTRPLEVEVASPSDGDLRTFRDDRALSMDDDNAERPECVLFCGWRRDMDDIVQVLDEFVTPGSELHIFCELPAEAQAERLREQRATRKRPLELSNLTVYHSEGLLCSRRDLEEKLPISSLSSIVILAEESEDLDATSKDSQALTTLLLLRDIQSTQPRRRAARGARDDARQSACDATDAVHAAVADAVLSPRSLDSPSPRSVEAPASSLSPSNSSGAEPRPVAPRPDVISDYVLSNDLVANALAMIAEDRTVNKLLKILMESEGSEFYIRRAADLVDVGRKQSFFDVMRAARLAFRGPEIAFGYVRAGEEPVLNPPRKRELKRWLKTDSFIVLAEG
ncbi:hypothetical protein JL720_11916 [Aureococcus anophagefferens]|nr:hypothetical protein JL720_11916 [Aureococcus anophagefferens]